MILKKLSINGFKSFADKTDIEFRNGLTGIVGPNGSGKSNIADALRWVVGELNSRTMRAAKSADLIFNGTEKRKPCNTANISKPTINIIKSRFLTSFIYLISPRLIFN